MNTATTPTAALAAIIREADTDAASIDNTLAQIDALGLTAELTATVKAQTIAGVEARAALAKSARIELDRRRRTGYYGRTVDLPYIS